jgi:hypothetical protein
MGLSGGSPGERLDPQEFVMPQTQVRAGRPRARDAWPLTAMLAAACCVSACGSSTPTAATASTTYGAHASPDTPAGQGQTAAAVSRGTPAEALADFIHQVAAGHRSASCQDMAAPTQSSYLAACMSAAAKNSFNALHGNFVIDGIKPGTAIRVTGPHVTGTHATISASDIHVAGTTLLMLMVKHSTGIKPGQFSLSFGLSRVDGAWYVTTMNMNVG